MGAVENMLGSMVPRLSSSLRVGLRPFSSSMLTNVHGTSYPVPAVGSVCPVFKSDAEARIAMVPPIKVSGAVARCDGGGGPLGHPVEYIQLNTKRGEPQTCKYCGLRFVYDGH